MNILIENENIDDAIGNCRYCYDFVHNMLWDEPAMENSQPARGEYDST